jgi:hypothetical protein
MSLNKDLPTDKDALTALLGTVDEYYKERDAVNARFGYEKLKASNVALSASGQPTVTLPPSGLRVFGDALSRALGTALGIGEANASSEMPGSTGGATGGSGNSSTTESSEDTTGIFNPNNQTAPMPQGGGATANNQKYTTGTGSTTNVGEHPLQADGTTSDIEIFDRNIRMILKELDRKDVKNDSIKTKELSAQLKEERAKLQRAIPPDITALDRAISAERSKGNSANVKELQAYRNKLIKLLSDNK